MDIFQFHNNVINEYFDYINSFIFISDDAIREKVEKELSAQKLWPDPLIQFNPSYEKSISIEKLSEQNIVVNELAQMFKGFQLYKHQEEGLRLGTSDKDFIVTSGTGTGKSLIFMGTIFNHLFKAEDQTHGVKALIVYPMNALINSQILELDKWKENYEINSNGTKLKLYQLKVDSIIWKVGNSKEIIPDKIRILSYKEINPRPNHFFQSFYLQRFDQFKNLGKTRMA